MCFMLLEFEGDNKTTLFLASSPEEAESWILHLQTSSYSYLKKKYTQLSQQFNQPKCTIDDIQ